MTSTCRPGRDTDGSVTTKIGRYYRASKAVLSFALRAFGLGPTHSASTLLIQVGQQLK